jgi:hypothetical protein
MLSILDRERIEDVRMSGDKVHLTNMCYMGMCGSSRMAMCDMCMHLTHGMFWIACATEPDDVA